jgi:hypothetical protein
VGNFRSLKANYQSAGDGRSPWAELSRQALARHVPHGAERVERELQQKEFNIPKRTSRCASTLAATRDMEVRIPCAAGTLLGTVRQRAGSGRLASRDAEAWRPGGCVHGRQGRLDPLRQRHNADGMI